MLDLITQQKKATVLFLSNGIKLEGGEKMNPYTWMTISQFFIQDEFLKRQIGYNTSNALKRIKEKGEKTLGRPKTHSEEQIEEVRKLFREGNKVCKIAETTKLPRTTINRMIEDLR